MKTLSFMLAALFLFTSCQKEKEGVYNPKKKISKVYYQLEDYPKELSEVWTWDGDLLKEVEGSDMTMLFYYKNDRIDYITDQRDISGLYYVYDGSEIDKIIIKENGVEVATVEYGYRKGKIVKMTVLADFSSILEDIGGFAAPAKNTRVPLLSYFVSPEILKYMYGNGNNYGYASTKAVSNSELNAEFEYDGDNVKKVTYTSQMNVEMDELPFPISIKLTGAITYSHDKKNNPYYGFPVPSTEYGYFHKNNITSQNISISATAAGFPVELPFSSPSSSYTYKYDDKFPIERISHISESYNGETTEYEEKTFWEYL
jgi:hypothetical protein